MRNHMAASSCHPQGFYPATCKPSFPQSVFGAVVSVSGTAQIYASQPEYASCSSVTQVAGQCGTTAGWASSAGAVSISGIYQPPAACPASCDAACRAGCIVCQDSSFIGALACGRAATQPARASTLPLSVF